MIAFIIGLMCLTFLFWIGFKVTGAILTAVVWVFIKIPIALGLFALGIIFFISILLIPLGKACFRIGKQIMF